MNLYPEQDKAVTLILDYLYGFTGNPVLEAPTGSGKSVIQAGLVDKVLRTWPNKTVLCLAHVAELLEQNEDAMIKLGISAEYDVGVYSASLNRRDIGQVTIASIQSVYKKAELLGHIDLIVVDEAHLINNKGDGMYRHLLAELGFVNPAIRVVGLTATPYRLSGGLLTDGDLFDHCINSKLFDMDMETLISRGKLAPLTTEPVSQSYSTEELTKRGGEYTNASLSEMVKASGDVTAHACAETLRLTEDRNKVLIFATNLDHAASIESYLFPHARVVSGDTPKRERAELVEDYKAGKFKYLVNVGVFTTGFNVTDVDCIALMRPTFSPGLYLQMLGRGMRVAPGKADCLVLDFANNIETHGPVTQVKPPKRRGAAREGDAPLKTCLNPECFALNYAQARECEECGTPFPVTESVSIEREASTIDIMGRDLIGEHWVTDHVVGIHHKKNSPPMLKIEYWSAIFPIATQYLCIYHPGYAGQKASEWFLNWTGFPVPRDIETAKQVLASTDDLPNRILVDSSGKYPQIKKWFYERQTERPPESVH